MQDISNTKIYFGTSATIQPTMKHPIPELNFCDLHILIRA